MGRVPSPAGPGPPSAEVSFELSENLRAQLLRTVELEQALFPGAVSTGLPTGLRTKTTDFTHLTSSTGRIPSPSAQRLHSSETPRVPVSARAAVARKVQGTRSARVDGGRATPEPLRPQSSQPSQRYGGFTTSRSPLLGSASVSELHVVGLGPSKSTSSLPSPTSSTPRRAASPSIEAATSRRGSARPSPASPIAYTSSLARQHGLPARTPRPSTANARPSRAETPPPGSVTPSFPGRPASAHGETFGFSQNRPRLRPSSAAPRPASTAGAELFGSRSQTDVSFLQEATGHGSSLSPAVPESGTLLRRVWQVMPEDAASTLTGVAPPTLQLRVPKVLAAAAEAETTTVPTEPGRDPHHRRAGIPPAATWTTVPLTGNPASRADAVALGNSIEDQLAAAALGDHSYSAPSAALTPASSNRTRNLLRPRSRSRGPSRSRSPSPNLTRAPSTDPVVARALSPSPSSHLREPSQSTMLSIEPSYQGTEFDGYDLTPVAAPPNAGSTPAAVLLASQALSRVDSATAAARPLPAYDVRKLAVLQQGMRELATQVGVQCAERAAALILLWNGMVGEFEGMLETKGRSDDHMCERVKALEQAAAEERLQRLTAEARAAEMEAKMNVALASEAHVRQQLYDAEQHLSDRIRHVKWRQDRDPATQAAAARRHQEEREAEAAAAEAAAEHRLLPVPSNEIIAAVEQLDALQVENFTAHKHRERARGVMQNAATSKQLALVEEESQKRLTILKGVGILEGDIDRMSMMMDTDGDVASVVNDLMERPREMTALLASMPPVRAAEYVEHIPLMDAAPVLAQLAPPQRAEILRASSAERVLALVGSCVVELSVELMTGLTADENAALLETMDATEAAETLAVMTQEMRDAVLRRMGADAAADMLRHLPAATSATSLKSLPVQRCGELLSLLQVHQTATVVEALSPRGGSDALAAIRPRNRAADVLQRLPEGVRASVMERMNLRDLSAVLEALPPRQRALLFVRLSQPMQVELLQLVTQPTEGDESTVNEDEATLAFMHVLMQTVITIAKQHAELMAALGRCTPRSAGGLHAEVAEVASLLVATERAISVAVGMLDTDTLGTLVCVLTAASQLRLVQVLPFDQQLQVLNTLDVHNPIAASKLLVQLSCELPELVHRASEALSADRVLRMLQPATLVECARVIAAAAPAVGLDMLRRVPDEQRQALVSCMELQHSDALWRLKELQLEQFPVSSQKKGKKAKSKSRPKSGGSKGGSKLAHLDIELTGWLKVPEEKGAKKGGKAPDLLPFREVQDEQPPTMPPRQRAPAAAAPSKGAVADATKRAVANLRNTKTAAPDQPDEALWDPAADHCFRPRDARLQSYMVVAAHFKPWAREWLLTTIHAVYALKQFQDGELRDCGLHPISLPDALLAYVHEEVAKQQLQDRWAFEKEVREQCCSILLAILKYERSDEYVRAFSYFLSEEWAPDVLDVYLRATALCGQDATKFPGDYVDYAPPDKPHKDHWVCVEKAALVASLLLRPCRAELQGALLASLRLAPSATAASDKDVKRYCDAHHLESEEAPELLKLKRNEFLLVLCSEYRRCERVLRRTLKDLFEGWDIEMSGCLSQQEVLDMAGTLLSTLGDHGTLPQTLAVQVWKHAWFADAAAGATPTVGAEGPLITLNGFVAASWHVPEIRDYVRLLHTPPPPPQSSLRLLQSLDSFLHVSAFRHSHVLGRTLIHMAAAAGITATPLVRSCLAEVGAAGRSGGESVRWYMRALRHLSDGAFDVIEERVRRVLEREEDDGLDMQEWMDEMEQRLRQVESGVQLMYGAHGLVWGDSTAPEKMLRRMNASAPCFVQRRRIAEQFRTLQQLSRVCEVHAANTIARRWRVWRQARAERERHAAQKGAAGGKALKSSGRRVSAVKAATALIRKRL